MGWALGQERIVELLHVQNGDTAAAAADVYLVIAGAAAEAQGLAFSERLRNALPGLRLETHCGGGSFKSQLKRADKSGARLALILGEAETERRAVGLKSLRAEEAQIEVPWDQAAAEIRKRLAVK
jgi:histidyl-tRNA synthetase